MEWFVSNREHTAVTENYQIMLSNLKNYTFKRHTVGCKWSMQCTHSSDVTIGVHIVTMVTVIIVFPTCKHSIHSNFCVVNDDVIIIQGQDTPLHMAAYEGHTDSVALLASNGADVNMKNKVS